MLTNPDTSRSLVDATAGEQATQPAYRVRKHEEGFTILLALPGVSHDLLSVSTKQDTLTVTGQRAKDIPEEWKCHRSSPSPAAYRLVLQLHPDLDPSSIRAHLDEGLLTLEISHRESARARRIDVN